MVMILLRSQVFVTHFSRTRTCHCMVQYSCSRKRFESLKDSRTGKINALMAIFQQVFVFVAWNDALLHGKSSQSCFFLFLLSVANTSIYNGAIWAMRFNFMQFYLQWFSHTTTLVPRVHLQMNSSKIDQCHDSQSVVFFKSQVYLRAGNLYEVWSPSGPASIFLPFCELSFCSFLNQ